jgi:hypothetical protein
MLSTEPGAGQISTLIHRAPIGRSDGSKPNGATAGFKQKKPRGKPRGFVGARETPATKIVKRKCFVSHHLIRKPEDHPRIESEGRLFGMMRPSLADLAATYSSKP